MTTHLHESCPVFAITEVKLAVPIYQELHHIFTANGTGQVESGVVLEILSIYISTFSEKNIYTCLFLALYSLSAL